MTRNLVPELVMFSDNDCPNSGADSIFGNDCTEGALTMWGYCGTCWLYEESRVPKAWSERIEALLLARVEELRT